MYFFTKASSGVGMVSLWVVMTAHVNGMAGNTIDMAMT